MLSAPSKYYFHVCNIPSCLESSTTGIGKHIHYHQTFAQDCSRAGDTTSTLLCKQLTELSCPVHGFRTPQMPTAARLWHSEVRIGTLLALDALTRFAGKLWFVATVCNCHLEWYQSISTVSTKQVRTSVTLIHLCWCYMCCWNAPATYFVEKAWKGIFTIVVTIVTVMATLLALDALTRFAGKLWFVATVCNCHLEWYQSISTVSTKQVRTSVTLIHLCWCYMCCWNAPATYFVEKAWKGIFTIVVTIVTVMATLLALDALTRFAGKLWFVATVCNCHLEWYQSISTQRRQIHQKQEWLMEFCCSCFRVQMHKPLVHDSQSASIYHQGTEASLLELRRFMTLRGLGFPDSPTTTGWPPLVFQQNKCAQASLSSICVCYFVRNLFFETTRAGCTADLGPCSVTSSSATPCSDKKVLIQLVDWTVECWASRSTLRHDWSPWWKSRSCLHSTRRHGPQWTKSAADVSNGHCWDMLGQFANCVSAA